ncbi:hypothetical protein AEAC466_13915 [Asticcacaulis sp. AC466]|uniref:hypothetical protein n=1 Tax=Asticcacaulis sp. AC466 TaxID=1282362 RepID=UPI0003C3E18C|nr:hypothetical protein [Asticcacaulis sp. AC466]ESQ83341.1 hypothetical protein AEAC466_13915 [Asticcacaulis sp. AC466]
MGVRTSCLIILTAGLTLSLTGCNRLGLCHEEHLKTIASPTGRYTVDIVAKTCVGSSAVKEVVLRRNEGLMKGGRTVATFDDAHPDRPADISVGWRGDRRIVIAAHGAKIWSFQPNWRDVRIMER